MDSEESHTALVPRLVKWGRIVTSKMYATYSELTDEQRKSIMAILHSIGNEDDNNILKWTPVPGKLKVVLCFPYALGFSCEEEKVPSTVVDLSKPILILATSTHCFAHLENHLSSFPKDGLQPFLQKHNFLSAEDINKGAYYKAYSVLSENEARRMTISTVENYDIVLCDLQNSLELPKATFSIVLVYGNHKLSKEQLNCLESIGEHVKVILFTTPAYEDTEECLSENTRVTKQPSTPKLVKYAEDITKADRMKTLLNKRQLSVLYKVAEQIQVKHYSDHPFVVSMEPNKGDVEMLCFLPYVLGKGLLYNHTEEGSRIDLSKPILIIASNPKSLSKLKKYFCDKPYLVESGYLEHDELERGILYKAHVVQDHFDAVTISNLADCFEIILTIKDYFQSLPADCFSVVVVFESNLLSKAEEQNIIYTFENTKTLLFRVASHETTEKFAAEVVSRLKYIQEYSDETKPRLVRNGKQIKEKMFSSSILTEQQKLGLRTLVDWFVYPDSQHQPAQVDTSIGYEQAGVMIYCLPYILGWGVSTRLIDEEELQLNKPILLLCNSVDALNQLWDLFCVNPVFVKSFVSSTNEADPLYKVHLVNSTESAKEARQEAISNDVVISPLEYLNALPDESFSAIVCYTFGILEEQFQRKTIKKFDRYSKLIFINVRQEFRSETTEKHKDPLTSVFIKFGGKIMNKQLFGEESSFDTQVMDGLKDIIKWFSHCDTKNQPMVVSGTSNSRSDNMIITCLPYMLGWAINENIIPSKEIDLDKPILILVYDDIALNNLRTILLYPFLTKWDILDTSLIQDGAYYTTKFIFENDLKSNIKEMIKGYDIIVTEAKCGECIPMDIFSLVLGYSSKTFDLSMQQTLERKIDNNVKLVFFQGTVTLDISNEDLDSGEACITKTATQKMAMCKFPNISNESDGQNSNEGIMEKHSKFTISKLKWFDQDIKDTDAERRKQTQQKKRRGKRNKFFWDTKKEKHSSNRGKKKYNKASLDGPYYRCECGREIEATDFVENGRRCHSSHRSSLPRGVPVLGMGLCSDCMQSVGVNHSKCVGHSNQQPQYFSKDDYTAEQNRREMPDTKKIVSILTNRSVTSVKTNSLAEHAIPKEVQSYKVGKTYYLKFIKISNNTKGVQAKIESVTKNLLYKRYNSKYYKELERVHRTQQCNTESHMQKDLETQIIEITGQKSKVKEHKKQLVARRKTYDVAESTSKDRIKEELLLKLKRNTLDTSELEKMKIILFRSLEEKSKVSLDKLVGVDKTEQGEQIAIDNPSVSDTGESSELLQNESDENKNNVQHSSLPIIQTCTLNKETPKTSSAEGYFTENHCKNNQNNKWKPVTFNPRNRQPILSSDHNEAGNCDLNHNTSSTNQIVEIPENNPEEAELKNVNEIQHTTSKSMTFMKKLRAKSMILFRKHPLRFWQNKQTDDKKTLTESIETERSTSFHLDTFLQENKEQIHTCPEETLNLLIQSTTPRAYQQTSLDRISMPKYFSESHSYQPLETSLNGNEIQMNDFQKRKSSIDLQILEIKKPDELHSVSQNETTNQCRLDKNHIEVGFKHDGNENHLISSEILALRNFSRDNVKPDLRSDNMEKPNHEAEIKIEMAQESIIEQKGEMGVHDTSAEQTFSQDLMESDLKKTNEKGTKQGQPDSICISIDDLNEGTTLENSRDSGHLDTV